MSLRWKRNQRLKCTCGGYWFVHRRGGGACDHSPTRAIHLAKRGGCPTDIAEAKLDHAMKNGVVVQPGEPCPF